MSEKCQNPGNISLNHIFKDNDILICLVCKENVKETLNVSSDIFLSNHVNSKKHQNNIRALFKLCVPSWSGSYVEIIPNLVFDVTFERNESSFVSRTANNFACLVCQENIAQGTDPNEIITSITNHIKTDLHLTNVKDSVFWVHQLDDELAFTMIHKSKVHCSICKQNVQDVITCPLRRAVDHLKRQHGIKYKVLVKQRATDCYTDEKGVCQILKSINLTGIDSPRASTSKLSYEDEGAELSVNTCEYDEDLVGSDVSADESKESSNETIDICVDALKCPECGEFIEIYNENAGFSMDVHLQKHKPLMSVYTESVNDYQDDVDYTCPICLNTIEIFNKNLELSFELHFEENVHEHERFTLADCGGKNRFDFLSRVFDSLPDEMRDQQSVFVLDGNKVFCKLCNCVVPSRKNVSEACKVFIYHMSTALHVNQFKVSRQFLFMAVANHNKQSFPLVDIKQRDNVFKHLCSQNPIIESNKKIIEKRQMNYYCTVCNKHICYSPKENIQTLNFVLHLNGKPHKNRLKQLKKKCITFDYRSKSQKEVHSNRNKEIIKTIISRVAKKCSVVKLNQTFINEKGGEFFCELCQVLMKFNETGSGLRKHCASLLHRTELSERALCYVSQLDHNKLTREQESVFNSLAPVPFFRPHRYFINHNGQDFCCIICNLVISGSTSTGKNVITHLFSLKHRINCFEVTCNQDGTPANLKCNDKPIPTQSIDTNEKSVKTPTTEINTIQKRAHKILSCLYTYSWIIRKHFDFIELRNGHFFCNKCEEHIICNSNGSQLKNHFLLKEHKF